MDSSCGADTPVRRRCSSWHWPVTRTNGRNLLLLLGGAALQRCDKSSPFNSALAAEVRVKAQSRAFRRLYTSKDHRKRRSTPAPAPFVFSPTPAYICKWSCCVVLAFGETHQWAQAHIFVCLDRLRNKPFIFHGFRSRNSARNRRARGGGPRTGSAGSGVSRRRQKSHTAHIPG